jgi:hypothetical protein
LYRADRLDGSVDDDNMFWDRFQSELNNGLRWYHVHIDVQHTPTELMPEATFVPASTRSGSTPRCVCRSLMLLWKVSRRVAARTTRARTGSCDKKAAHFKTSARPKQCSTARTHARVATPNASVDVVGKPVKNEPRGQCEA